MKNLDFFFFNACNRRYFVKNIFARTVGNDGPYGLTPVVKPTTRNVFDTNTFDNCSFVMP